MFRLRQVVTPRLHSKALLLLFLGGKLANGCDSGAWEVPIHIVKKPRNVGVLLSIASTLLFYRQFAERFFMFFEIDKTLHPRLWRSSR